GHTHCSAIAIMAAPTISTSTQRRALCLSVGSFVRHGKFWRIGDQIVRVHRDAMPVVISVFNLAVSSILDVVTVGVKDTAVVLFKKEMTGEINQGCAGDGAMHLLFATFKTKVYAMRHGHWRIMNAAREVHGPITRNLPRRSGPVFSTKGGVPNGVVPRARN